MQIVLEKQDLTPKQLTNSIDNTLIEWCCHNIIYAHERSLEAGRPIRIRSLIFPCKWMYIRRSRGTSTVKRWGSSSLIKFLPDPPPGPCVLEGSEPPDRLICRFTRGGGGYKFTRKYIIHVFIGSQFDSVKFLACIESVSFYVRHKPPQNVKNEKVEK